MKLCTSSYRAVPGMELMGYGVYSSWISLIASRLFSRITVPDRQTSDVETQCLLMYTTLLSFVIIQFIIFTILMVAKLYLVSLIFFLITLHKIVKSFRFPLHGLASLICRSSFKIIFTISSMSSHSAAGLSSLSQVFSVAMLSG